LSNVHSAGLGVVLVAAACGGTAEPIPGEALVVSVAPVVSFAGRTFPDILLTVSASGTSNLGNPVTVDAVTVDGATVTASIVVQEGTHALCASVHSASGKTATRCESVALSWPKVAGRALRWTAAQGDLPPDLQAAIGSSDTLDAFGSDGAFAFPTVLAQARVRVAFTSPDIIHSVGYAEPTQALIMVLVPRSVTIPSCSVHGGTLVSLDLDRAYRPSAAGNTAFLDRANTAATVGRYVVASWNRTSIPVALSDTGSAEKRFSASDSTELRAGLDLVTAYFCQAFHFAPMAEANVSGVVVTKDPGFAALGAHSMTLPPVRGDYERASVVLRRITPPDEAARDSTRRTIAHEFLHVLGFGHTCGWASIMTTGTICGDPSLPALRPTPEDVAHYFAMLWARQGERALGTVQSLANAYAGDQVARGRSEPVIQGYFTVP
jgi:hypothetical protein